MPVKGGPFNSEPESRAKSAHLDDFLIDAHRRQDLRALVDGYTAAADLAAQDEDDVRHGFFLTQAWVFALEAHLPVAEELHRLLLAMGRAD